jgi:hypothetical protein
LGNHVSPKMLFFDRPFNSILCSTPTFADLYQWLPSVAQNKKKINKSLVNEELGRFFWVYWQYVCQF